MEPMILILQGGTELKVPDGSMLTVERAGQTLRVSPFNVHAGDRLPVIAAVCDLELSELNELVASIGAEE